MDEINIERLKEQFQEGTFYYSNSNILVKGKIYNVISYDDGQLEIFFAGGIVDLYKDKLTKVRRPPNIIGAFKWCYALKNENSKVIGYIGLKESEKREYKEKIYLGILKELLEEIEKNKGSK